LATREALSVDEKLQHALRIADLINVAKIVGPPNHDQGYFQCYQDQIDLSLGEIGFKIESIV
jgi:hypothetical protein